MPPFHTARSVTIALYIRNFLLSDERLVADGVYECTLEECREHLVTIGLLRDNQNQVDMQIRQIRESCDNYVDHAAIQGNVIRMVSTVGGLDISTATKMCVISNFSSSDQRVHL